MLANIPRNHRHSRVDGNPEGMGKRGVGLFRPLFHVSQQLYEGLEKSRKYARSYFLLPSSIALLVIFVAACSEDAEPTAIVLPTATPGTMSVTVTPTILQDEDDKKVQVGFNLGLQGYSQQGAGVVRQLDRGTWIKVTVRPAPGTIQQISIRQGRCENATDLPNFQWVETLDPAIGGVSETTLTERHVSTILDGNHAIAVSIPGGTFSQVATCGDLPDLSHLEIPESAEG